MFNKVHEDFCPVCMKAVSATTERYTKQRRRSGEGVAGLDPLVELAVVQVLGPDHGRPDADG